MIKISLLVLLVVVSCKAQNTLLIQAELSIIDGGGTPFIPDCSQVNVDTSDIELTLYNQNNPNGLILTDGNRNQIIKTQKTGIAIHGWLEKSTQPWIFQLRDALFQLEKRNFIVVDWSSHSLNAYGRAYCASQQVGEIVGTIIYNTYKQVPLDITTVRVYGFNLGCQIAGFAGQRFISHSANTAKIGRINCLDPARPGFVNKPISERIDATDADFVHVIHTSNGRFGLEMISGHVDFVLNFKEGGPCGDNQPGCPDVSGVQDPATEYDFANDKFCSPIRSAAYMIHSIITKGYVGRKCTSCSAFRNNDCANVDTEIMGYDCPTTARGVYYVRTNSRYPFQQG